eukprot:scaffold109_cov368-Pavlova_lutheri.AAC.25
MHANRVNRHANVVPVEDAVPPDRKAFLLPSRRNDHRGCSQPRSLHPPPSPCLEDPTKERTDRQEVPHVA